MHTATLRAVGGLVMMALPKALLDALGLKPNAKVGLRLEEGRLVIEPLAKPRYTLAELVTQCDPDAPASEEDAAWLADEPAGREAI